MLIDFKDFEKIYLELDKIFTEDWSKELEQTKKEMIASEKLLKSKFQFDSALASNPLQTRIEEIKKLREEHKHFIELSQSLVFSQDDSDTGGETELKNSKLTKEIEDAYLEFGKIDVLDLSGKGKIKNRRRKFERKIKN